MVKTEETIMRNSQLSSNAEYNKSKYYRRVASLKDWLGGKCVECGSTDSLEFDHVDPTKKSFTISQRWSKPWMELIKEVEKCQLLCKPCHKKKSDNEQTVRQHGDYSMYRRGNCRCELCVKAYRKYSREYNRKARSSNG